MSWARPWAVALVLGSGASGCRCGVTPGAADGSPELAAASDAGGGGGATIPTTLRWSAPIAAARAPGALLVAGLDAARGVIVLARLAPDGKVISTHDVLGEVRWVQNASLALFASKDGHAFVLWSGVHRGQAAAVLQAVSPDGAPRGEPEAASAGACATEEGVAWPALGAHPAVRMRRWADGAATDLFALARDESVLFACGAHQVFPFVEEDGRIALRQRGKPLMLARSDGEEDEHDHAEYTRGDNFGVVYPMKDHIAFREVHDGAAGPWKKLAAHLSGEQGLLAADADDRWLYLLSSHATTERCADGATRSELRLVRALRAGTDLATLQESETSLGTIPCGGETGPFWSASAGDGFVMAWAERVRAPGQEGGPAVTALAHIRIGGALPVAVDRVPLTADAVAEAGCEGGACMAVALMRDPGADALRTDALHLVRY